MLTWDMDFPSQLSGRIFSTGSHRLQSQNPWNPGPQQLALVLLALIGLVHSHFSCRKKKNKSTLLTAFDLKNRNTLWNDGNKGIEIENLRLRWITDCGEESNGTENSGEGINIELKKFMRN